MQNININKTTFCLYLSLFLGISVSPHLSQASVINNIKNNTSSMVNIYTKIKFNHNQFLRSYDRHGAGVIIDPNGIIVTNAHIVKGATEIQVKFFNGKQIPAKVVDINHSYDFALIKINSSEPLHPIEWGNSELLKLRDEVITLGNSPIFNRTITGGKIIGIGNSKSSSRNRVALIQANFISYKGDSGAPLLNDKGQFVGLIAAGHSKKERSVFAIPSNTIFQQYRDYKLRNANKK